MDEIAFGGRLGQECLAAELDESLRRLTEIELRCHLRDVQLVVRIRTIDLLVEPENLLPLVQEPLDLLHRRREVEGHRLAQSELFQLVGVGDTHRHGRK